MSVVPTARPAPFVVRTIEIDDPGDLLAAMPVPGISWVRRGEGMIAWGEAARLETSGDDRFVETGAWWTSIAEHAVVRDEVGVRGTGLVAFGAFPFSPRSPRPGTLVVPRYVIGRRGGTSWLTAQVAGADIAVPSLDAALADAIPVTPLGRVRVDRGDERGWTESVAAVVGRIRAGAVDKVVLARSVEAVANEPIDVRAVLQSLARAYPTCWTFHVDGVLGATPELLARVDRRLVTSRVLAGTIRPTGDETADLAHAADLARSSKDREEHEYAVTSVTRALARHCSSINVPEEPSVVHLPNVMHLATDVTGVLADDTTSLEVVAALHPSAAVCGTPTAAAFEIISGEEARDRGRYSGPVGWIDGGGDGEWCLALRAAEVESDSTRLRLFAGCGIVAASNPHDEWAESEAKLEPLREALGVGAT